MLAAIGKIEHHAARGRAAFESDVSLPGPIPSSTGRCSAVICGGCGAQVSAGGEPPGLCLAIGVAAAGGALTAWTLGWSTVAVVAASAVPLCVAAAWTTTIDNYTPGIDGRTTGGRGCPACGHVNRLRLWSW
jgi:hypothetical protein